MAINTQVGVGPYVGVSRDEVKTLTDGRKFRLVLYGAYNAFGLVGSEYNGVVVLDEDNMKVVVDNIARTGSGWYGPTQEQTAVFEALVAAPDSQFIEFVNEQDNLRYRI